MNFEDQIVISLLSGIIRAAGRFSPRTAADFRSVDARAGMIGKVKDGVEKLRTRGTQRQLNAMDLGLVESAIEFLPIASVGRAGAIEGAAKDAGSAQRNVDSKLRWWVVSAGRRIEIKSRRTRTEIDDNVGRDLISRCWDTLTSNNILRKNWRCGWASRRGLAPPKTLATSDPQAIRLPGIHNNA